MRGKKQRREDTWYSDVPKRLSLPHRGSFSKSQSPDGEAVLQKDLAPFNCDGARLSGWRWDVDMDFEDEEGAAGEKPGNQPTCLANLNLHAAGWV